MAIIYFYLLKNHSNNCWNIFSFNGKLKSKNKKSVSTIRTRSCRSPYDIPIFLFKSLPQAMRPRASDSCCFSMISWKSYIFIRVLFILMLNSMVGLRSTNFTFRTIECLTMILFREWMEPGLIFLSTFPSSLLKTIRDFGSSVIPYIPDVFMGLCSWVFLADLSRQGC